MTIREDTYISGPRWALPNGIIRKLAIDSGLPVKIDYEERKNSFLSTRIFFGVSGEEDDVIHFLRGIAAAVDERNGRR